MAVELWEGSPSGVKGPARASETHPDTSILLLLLFWLPSSFPSPSPLPFPSCLSACFLKTGSRGPGPHTHYVAQHDLELCLRSLSSEITDIHNHTGFYATLRRKPRPTHACQARLPPTESYLQSTNISLCATENTHH